MEKTQLINGLIGNSNLIGVLQKLTECYKETDTSQTYGKKLLRQSEEILRALELKQDVYLKNKSEHGEARVLSRCEHSSKCPIYDEPVLPDDDGLCSLCHKHEADRATILLHV